MTPTDPVYSITSCYSTALHSIDTVVAVLPVSRLFFFSSHSIFTLFLSHAAAMFFHILYICVLESFPRFSPFFSFSSFLFLSLSLSFSLPLSIVILHVLEKAVACFSRVNKMIEMVTVSFHILFPILKHIVQSVFYRFVFTTFKTYNFYL